MKPYWNREGHSQTPLHCSSQTQISSKWDSSPFPGAPGLGCTAPLHPDANTLNKCPDFVWEGVKPLAGLQHVDSGKAPRAPCVPPAWSLFSLAWPALVPSCPEDPMAKACTCQLADPLERLLEAAQHFSALAAYWNSQGAYKTCKPACHMTHGGTISGPQGFYSNV